MAAEEPRDWIDRTIAHDVWEPPAGFVDRVAARGMALRSARRRRVTLMDVVESMRFRLEGSLWVARQYRHLLFGHS